MKFKPQENLTDISYSRISQLSKLIDSTPIKIPRKRGSWPARKANRVCPQTKAMLIDLFFSHHKRIRDISKELKINYCTAKTIIHTYRKKKHPPMLGSKARTCAFCPIRLISNTNQLKCSIVSLIGGKITSDQECNFEKFQNQIIFTLKNVNDYVEKFLMGS